MFSVSHSGSGLGMVGLGLVSSWSFFRTCSMFGIVKFMSSVSMCVSERVSAFMFSEWVSRKNVSSSSSSLPSSMVMSGSVCVWLFVILWV